MGKKKTSPDDPSALNLEITVLLSSMFDHEVAAVIEHRIRNVLLQTSEKVETLLAALVQKGIMDEKLVIRVTAARVPLDPESKKKVPKAKGKGAR